MIYLDNAATTPTDPLVIEAMTESFRRDFANPGTVYRPGLDARNRVEAAREEIAALLHVPSGYRIVFTSGGSEANNLMIKGLCFPGKKAACSGLEHPSVTETLAWLAELDNAPLVLPAFRKEGWLDAAAAAPALKENRVRLLCLSHVNNELGSVHDPREIAPALAAGSPQTRLFLDGAQAVGKVPIDAVFWRGLAGYSASAHKFNGPKGIGMLIYDSRLELVPQIHGGRQQSGARSGTLPVPLIVGMALAVKLAVEPLERNRAHLARLQALLIDRLRDAARRSPNLELRFNSPVEGAAARRSPAIVNFSVPPVEGEVLLHHLEQKGIYAGMGSACSAQGREPSKILTGIGLSTQAARCSLRVSLGPQNTERDVTEFAAEFARAYEELYPAFSRAAAR